MHAATRHPIHCSYGLEKCNVSNTSFELLVAAALEVSRPSLLRKSNTPIFDDATKRTSSCEVWGQHFFEEPGTSMRYNGLTIR